MKFTASTRRQIERAFTRRNLAEFGRSMVWVVPLTILIWIYAEREQITRAEDVSFPVQVHIGNSSSIAAIVRPADRTIVVSLEGPRVKLDDLRAEITSGVPVTLELDPATPVGPLTRRTVDTLNDLPKFKAAGVEVKSATPKELAFRVDELVTRDATVIADAGAPGSMAFDAPPVFDPPTVRITGPKPLIEKLPVDASGRLVIRADFQQSPLLKNLGVQEISDVTLVKPRVPGDEEMTGELTITPERVRSTFKIRQANVTYMIPSMPVFPLAPASFLDEYTASFEPVLPNVTVQGSPEMIAALKAGTLPRKPKAILEFGREDLPAGRVINRKLTFDLPEGLTVSPMDRDRSVDLTLTPRSCAD